MRKLAIIFLALVCAACVGGDYYTTPTPVIITATPPPSATLPEGYDPSATPTQEVTTFTPVPTSDSWDTSCLDDEFQQAHVRSPNPCLSGTKSETARGQAWQRPFQYVVVAPEPPDTCGPGWRDDTGFRVNLSYCTGDAGYGFSGAYFANSAACNLLIVEGDSTITVESGEEYNGYINFYVVVTFHYNGQAVERMQPIGFEGRDGFDQPIYYLMRPYPGEDGKPVWRFPFQFENATDVTIDVTARSNFALGRPGATFRFTAIKLLEVPDAYCNGVEAMP